MNGQHKPFTAAPKKNLVGATTQQYDDAKALAGAFLSENRLYTGSESAARSAVSEYILWEKGLSARLPQGQTVRYTDGQDLAKHHMKLEIVNMDVSPSANDEEFNNGYWDYIAAEKKRLKEFLESIDKLVK